MSTTTWLDGHGAELAGALRTLRDDADRLDRWADELLRRLLAGGRLLAAGNGGSAAEAQHLTSELVGRFLEDRRPFSALSLCAETSSLTAIVNDYGADELFARQVEAHGRPGDVLVLLSTSGASPNVLHAARRGRAAGLRVWAMTGPQPNELARLADDALCVRAPSTAAVQAGHLVAVHALCAALDERLAGRDGAPSAAAAPGARTVDVWQQPGPATAGDGAPRRTRVVVVGDVLLDRDVDGRVERLCPDAPAPVLDVDTVRESPGGAGLAALLCAQSGADVLLAAPVADDDAGRRLTDLLGGQVRLLPLPHEGPTRTKVRLRSGGRSLVRLDEGGPGAPGDVPEALLDALGAALAGADAVLVSDYGAGVTHHPQVRALLAEAAARTRVVWDPHPRGGPPVAGLALVTPNEAEAAAAVRAARLPHAERAAHPDVLADGLRAHWQARAVAVTCGARGAFLAAAQDPQFVPAVPAAGGDPCGAGDRFAATATVVLGAGDLVSTAVAAAVGDASAWVAQGGAEGFRTRAAAPVRGVADPGPDAVDAVPAGTVADAWSADDLGSLAARLRIGGRTLVATGGCFDIVHAGHVATLQAARRLGDALVVVMNSDDSVRRLKGAGRPVVPAPDRARVLEALDCVDAVVVFDEDDPRAVLDRLRPDVWAKGGDYGGAPLPEAEVVRFHAGRVVLLPYLDGRSTTSIIERTGAARARAL